MDKKRIKIMVFGKSGAGKSQSLNLICGLQKDQHFKVANNPDSFTQKCEQYDGTLFGNNKLNITAIDVPGLYDTKDVIDNQQQEPMSLIHLKAIGNFVRDNWGKKINKVILCIEATEKGKNTQIKNIIFILKKIVVDPSDIFVLLTKCQVAQDYVGYWIESLHSFGLQYIFKVGEDFEESDKLNIQIILEFQIEKELRFWEDFSLLEKIQIAQMFNFKYQEVQKGCFSLNMKIALKNGQLYGTKEILEKGEYQLMLNDNTFLGYIHYDTEIQNRFLCFQFQNKENYLEVTDNHLIFCYKKQNGEIVNNFIKAKELRQGDFLISQKADQKGNIEKQELQISQIQTEIKLGFWCPLTSTGQLIVNNILVSAYDISLNELISQDQAHLAMMPLLFYRQIFGFKKQNILLNKQKIIQSKYQKFGTTLFNLFNSKKQQ